jgi:hypothetical protein
MKDDLYPSRLRKAVALSDLDKAKPPTATVEVFSLEQAFYSPVLAQMLSSSSSLTALAVWYLSTFQISASAGTETGSCSVGVNQSQFAA